MLGEILLIAGVEDWKRLPTPKLGELSEITDSGDDESGATALEVDDPLRAPRNNESWPVGWADLLRLPQGHTSAAMSPVNSRKTRGPFALVLRYEFLRFIVRPPNWIKLKTLDPELVACSVGLVGTNPASSKVLRVPNKIDTSPHQT